MSCAIPVIPDAARTAVQVTRSDARNEIPVGFFAVDGGVRVEYVVPPYFPGFTHYIQPAVTATISSFLVTTRWSSLINAHLYIAGVTAGLRSVVDQLVQPTLPRIPLELQGLTAEALRALTARQNENEELWAQRLIESVDPPDQPE